MFIVSVIAGDRIFNPFCDIHRMVSDTLHIFGRHKEIKSCFCIQVLVHQCRQFFLDLIKSVIYLVIIINDFSAEFQIFFYKRIDAFCHHADSHFCHLSDQFRNLHMVVLDKLRKISDIRRLVSDTLHV